MLLLTLKELSEVFITSRCRVEKNQEHKRTSIIVLRKLIHLYQAQRRR
jgi:hypothetical protein